MKENPLEEMKESPIFEIIQTHRHIRIYANGVVEGLEGDGRIINHIPLVMRLEFMGYFSKSQDSEPCKSPKAIPNISCGTGASHGMAEYRAKMSANEAAATGEK